MRIALLLATLLSQAAFAGPGVEDLILAGRYADAAPLAEKQAEKAPTDVDAQVRYIDVMKALGLGAAVEPVYASRAKVHPTDPDAQYLRGRSANSLDRAEAGYSAALTLQPGHARAQVGMGHVRRAQGDLSGAESAYRSALTSDDTLGEAWSGLGSVLVLQGRKDAALEVGQRAMARVPDRPEAYLAVAALEPASAGTVLAKAVAAVPADPRVHAALARHRLSTGDARGAMEAAKKALELDPLEPEARRWTLYAAAVKDGTLDAAGFNQAEEARQSGRVAAWTPLLAGYPKCALLWVERSAAHAARNDLAAARADAEKALELDPDNIEAHAALGLLLLEDDPIAAKPHLRTAAEGRGVDASLQVAVAMAEARTGEMQAARKRLKTTVDLHPYDIRALLTYGQVLSAEDAQATYDLMADAVQRMPDTRVVLAFVGAAKDAGKLDDAAALLEDLSRSTGNPAFKEAASLLRGHPR